MNGDKDKDGPVPVGKTVGEYAHKGWNGVTGFFGSVADGWKDDKKETQPSENSENNTEEPSFIENMLGLSDKDGDGAADGLGLGKNLGFGTGLTALFNKVFGMNLMKSFLLSSVIMTVLNFIPKLRDVFNSNAKKGADLTQKPNLDGTSGKFNQNLTTAEKDENGKLLQGPDLTKELAENAQQYAGKYDTLPKNQHQPTLEIDS
ncbi:MAG: hypothetical protein KDJ35_02395 [Alphaproteobacteria bacterium]|nr:hypothetical protein [Alphaproteobacteria bacterium]